MADYKSMYYKLFNEVTDTIERLQKIQQECEELFIKSEEDNLKNLKYTKMILKLNKCGLFTRNMIQYKM